MYRPVIIFDGFCNLCSGTIQFLIRHDSNNQFRYVAGQSKEGLDLLTRYNLKVPETIFLIGRDRVFSESDAVLEISNYLGYPWKLIRILKVIPGVIRNALYRFISRNRYRWFGKRDTCASNSE